MWVTHAAVLYVPALCVPARLLRSDADMGHGRPSDEAAGTVGEGGAPEVTGQERAQAPLRSDL